MDTPDFIVHQIWLGGELPKNAKKLVEKAYKTCGKSGYEYRIWYLKDILQTFNIDYSYYFWRRLFTQFPIAPVMSAAVDYYKWKILAATPEEQNAIYIDCDVEMMRKPKTDYVIPKTQAHISFGSAEQYGTPDVSYIQVHGPKAASVALQQADEKLLQFGMDSPHFIENFVKLVANGKKDSRLSLGTDWILKELLPAYEKAEIAAEVAAQDVYCYYGQTAKQLMINKSLHLSTEGAVDEEAIAAYAKEKIQQAKAAEDEFNKTKKHVVIYMSSAREYDANLDRTLGLITAADIRNVQRGTTFEELSPNVDYSFVVGGTTNDGHVDDGATDIFYASYPEGRDHQAQRFYQALKWSVKADIFENIFFCEDDNYVSVNRLLKYCNAKMPDEMVCIAANKDGHPDAKGGILITAALARKIVLTDPDEPREGESFGDWIYHCLELVDAKFEPEQKFASNKNQYPSPTNARITTHECNPYDLVALHRLNKA